MISVRLSKLLIPSEKLFKLKKLISSTISTIRFQIPIYTTLTLQQGQGSASRDPGIDTAERYGDLDQMRAARGRGIWIAVFLLPDSSPDIQKHT